MLFAYMENVMKEEANHANANLMRSNIAANGDTTFVDFDNLHPENETAASLNGALAGGGLGATVLALTALVGADTQKPLLKKLFTGPGLAVAAAIVAVPAAIGAYTSVLRARTHNEWSNRVLNRVEHDKHGGMTP